MADRKKVIFYKLYFTVKRCRRITRGKRGAMRDGETKREKTGDEEREIGARGEKATEGGGKPV